jgi:small conductance mechanosensitive channel
MDPTTVLTDLSVWLQAHWLAVLVLAVGAFVVFRAARPLVHRLVVRLMATSQSSDVDAAIAAEETRKRAETIEDLLARMIKLGVILTVILVLLTVLGLLPVIAGLGLIVAALALAGQSIVLDYLMGLLILLEGQYYKGDWIAVGTAEGTVEEVGLRRTVIRDASGTVHSISNGEIRISSNFTRVYASLQVDVTILRGVDLDRATSIADRVGRELADDPEWRDRLLDTPRFVRVVAFGEQGVTLRVGGRVRAVDRWAVPGELRRRLAIAIDEAGIEVPVRGRVLVSDPSASSGGGASTPAGAPPTAPGPPPADRGSTGAGPA